MALTYALLIKNMTLFRRPSTLDLFTGLTMYSKKQRLYFHAFNFYVIKICQKKSVLLSGKTANNNTKIQRTKHKGGIFFLKLIGQNA